MMVFLANARTFAMSNAKGRIPLIKFRYGYNKLSAGNQQAAPQGIIQQPQPIQKMSQPHPSSSTVAFDESELPQRFHRQVISEEEIAYINRGGPA